jgi:hypothetical protein
MKRLLSILMGILLVLSVSLSVSALDYPSKEKDRQGIVDVYKKCMNDKQATMGANMAMEIQDFIADKTDVNDYFSDGKFYSKITPELKKIMGKYVEQGLDLLASQMIRQINDETCEIRVNITFYYKNSRTPMMHSYYPFQIKGIQPDCSIHRSPDVEL